MKPVSNPRATAAYDLKHSALSIELTVHLSWKHYKSLILYDFSTQFLRTPAVSSQNSLGECTGFWIECSKTALGKVQIFSKILKNNRSERSNFQQNYGKTALVKVHTIAKNREKQPWQNFRIRPQINKNSIRRIALPSI